MTCVEPGNQGISAEPTRGVLTRVYVHELSLSHLIELRYLDVGYSLTQLLFVSGSVVVAAVTSIKFTYGISSRVEAGSSDVKLDNEHT